MTTTFFCNTTTKALCRSPVAYSVRAFCCFVSLLVLDFLWITSLNFCLSLTPESTTTTASKRVDHHHHVCRRAKIRFLSFAATTGFVAVLASGLLAGTLSLDFVTSAFFPKVFFMREMFPAFDDANRLPSLCLSPRAILIGGSSALRSIPARRTTCGVTTTKAAKPPQVDQRPDHHHHPITRYVPRVATTTNWFRGHHQPLLPPSTFATTRHTHTLSLSLSLNEKERWCFLR